MELFRKRRDREIEDNYYLLWILIAVEFFMSFSFMGYVHIAPISLTFVYIPVMVAGCILGPKNSTIVGAVFGIASMWKALAFYVATGDAIFSPAMSGKPLASILLSVGSRALFGLIIGILYRVAKNSRHPIAGILLVSTVGFSSLHRDCGCHCGDLLSDIQIGICAWGSGTCAECGSGQ